MELICCISLIILVGIIVIYKVYKAQTQTRNNSKTDKALLIRYKTLIDNMLEWFPTGKIIDSNEQSITIFEPSEDHGDQTMMLMVVGNTLFIYYRIISPLIGPQKVDLVFPANYDQNEIANRTLERMSELFEGFD